MLLNIGMEGRRKTLRHCSGEVQTAPRPRSDAASVLSQTFESDLPPEPNPKPVDHSRHPGDAEDEGGFIQVDNGERGGPTMWLISLLHGNRLELPSRARISGGCDVSTGTIWPEVRVGASRIAATPFSSFSAYSQAPATRLFESSFGLVTPLPAPIEISYRPIGRVSFRIVTQNDGGVTSPRRAVQLER